jgi:hypothetical protein
MGGQPWPSSRSINGDMASSRERKGREGEGARLGCVLGRGRAVGGSWGLSPPCCCVAALCSVAARVRRNKKEEEEKRREEKREKRKEEGKEKKKKVPNLEIFEK